MREFTALVHMAEKVADYGEGSCEHLDWDMEATVDNAQDHADWEENTPRQDLDEDVYP